MDYIDDNKLKKLKKDIGKERYLHSLNVVKVAKELGKRYNCDLKKCEIAALYHDCGKLIPFQRQIDKLKEYNISLDQEILDAKPIVHAYLGAYIAKNEYGIIDTEILNAIKYHTIGRENMTMLEKIIFVADFIEPNRSFEGVEKLRNLAFENLDKTVYEGVKQNIIFIVNSDYYIYEPAIKIYNHLRSKNYESI
ncbi:MAG: bis(5'-nucleosyl)-tetraphosphatase (symmetrical) YqeK [Tissierellia bacterium]|nr:bis(5'-nucleosyl)-tetraphosphatase (symmetrical) YqeK [Tissierellia bacterium]